jgi:putative heme-binding domain-containing protein
VNSTKKRASPSDGQGRLKSVDSDIMPHIECVDRRVHRRALPKEMAMHWIKWAQIPLIWTLIMGVWAVGPVAQEPEVTDRAAAGEDNLFTTRFDRRMGERSFQRQCSRCHGQDAQGNDETGAPDLTTGRFANASSPTGVFNVIRSGISGTAMLPVAANTPDKDIWQLVTYIDSLSANPADFDLAGNVPNGRQIYAGKGNCSNCHMINSDGSRLGPDLSRVGERRRPTELKSDLMTPNAEVNPRWWTVKVTRADGSIVEGLRMSEDTFTIRLMDQDANLWPFLKSEIQSYERNQESTMPSYEQTLTTEESDDLVAYLFSLRKERTQ